MIEINPPAFPMLEPIGQEVMYGLQFRGMSLLDYFAASALAGMLGGVPGQHLIPKNAAREAYDHANAMLKERANLLAEQLSALEAKRFE